VSLRLLILPLSARDRAPTGFLLGSGPGWSPELGDVAVVASRFRGPSRDEVALFGEGAARVLGGRTTVGKRRRQRW
jgi:hypothetical protein